MSKTIFFTAFLFLLLAIETKAQSPLFSSDSLLILQLRTNMRSLLKDVADKKSYHEAHIKILAQEENFEVPCLVQTRGNFRRQRKNCQFAPLRLKFNTDSAKGSIFEGQRKIKLVTHCRNRKKAYEENLLIEYLIYKLYEKVSPVSYRTRLAKIHYKDESKYKDTLFKYAFFLESKSELEPRIQKKELKVETYYPLSIDLKSSADIFLFQFMIANTDWSMSNMHNVVLFSAMTDRSPLPLIYDFDWAGIISAPYAVPNEKLGIKHVSERLYRGYCIPERYLWKSREKLLELKAEFHDLIMSFEHLNEKRRKKVWRFIAEFYEIIENEDRFQRSIIEACRKVQN